MSSLLYRIGRFAASRPWVAIGAWVVVAVAVVVASATGGRDLQDSMKVPGLDSQKAVDLLSAAKSADAGLTAQIVIQPLDKTAVFDGESSASKALSSLRDRLDALPKVLGASDPLTSGGVSADGRVALIRLQYPVMEELAVADLDNLKQFVADARSDSPLQIEMGGDLFFNFEKPATNVGEFLGLLTAVVILLVAFGSVIAMGLPIGLALFGLAIGISAMTLLNHLIDIPSFSTTIASMIGLGVGIDYALFLVTRHREHLAEGMTVEESAGRAVATAGLSVVFAGGTVVVSILGLAIAGMPFLTAAGIAISTVVLVMVVASITLLPAFLGLAGHWINRLGLPHARRSHRPRGLAGWQRWGSHVSRHAVPYAIGSVVLLLALAAPVLALRLGFPDEGSLPESRTERRAYDLVADGFGPGTNGPLLITVDISRDSSVVEPLRAAISRDPGIAATAPAQVDLEAGVAVIAAIPTTSPQDERTVQTVKRLRSAVFPPVLDGTDATAHVGGQTASFADLGNQVKDRLPWFITAVVLVSFLLLAVVFRSILVPLKAALLNLLSIGASYGVLVMVFQWQGGGSLIGLNSAVPIVSFIPMMMFAIVFGLSMDYEVFLLSRIRERYLDTHDNQASVVHGLASTARVITSAALIMVSVFAGFVLGEDPSIKMLGLGLATAIFVDATLVRIVLVPAAMKLMGDANWWLPNWLDRRMPTIDMDGRYSTARSSGSEAAGSARADASLAAQPD